MGDNQQRAVGIFSDPQQAQASLNQLKDSDFPMDQVSVIAKQADGTVTVIF